MITQLCIENPANHHQNKQTVPGEYPGGHKVKVEASLRFIFIPASPRAEQSFIIELSQGR